MTAEEKRILATYRKQGVGYKKITQLMGLSVNTVKTYCKRNALGGMITVSPCSTGKACKYCGAPLVQTPGKKHGIFCSDVCRSKWRNAHPELVNHRSERQVICTCCGQAFMRTVRMLDTHEEIIGLSRHLLAVSRKDSLT